MLWGVVGGLAVVLLIAVWVVTVGDLISRHLGRGKTAAWLLIVVVLPFAGSILYWILRKPSQDEVERQYEDQVALREEARRSPFGSTGIR